MLFRNGFLDSSNALSWCNYFLCNDSTRHHQSCNTYHARRPSSAQLTFRKGRSPTASWVCAIISVHIYIEKHTEQLTLTRDPKPHAPEPVFPSPGVPCPILISTLSRTTFSVLRSTDGRGCVLHGDQQPRRHLRRRRRSAHGRGGRGRWRARRRQRRRVRVGAAWWSWRTRTPAACTR